jgi:hypothetical protein
MKHYRICLAAAVLAMVSLACQTLSGGTGGGNEPVLPTSAGDSNTPAVATTDPGGNGNTSSTGFPMTADAYNVTEIGDGSVLYYTKLSLEEVMAFYRAEYTSRGYTERELLTVVEADAGVFSMVFDGDPSGKGVVIQSVDLGDGSRTVAIRLEDV